VLATDSLYALHQAGSERSERKTADRLAEGEHPRLRQSGLSLVPEGGVITIDV